MPVEVEHWIVKRRDPDISVATDVVRPGIIIPVNFFGAIRLAVACGIDDNTSGVVINTQKRNGHHLYATLFRDEEDAQGTPVDFSDGTISIVRPQELLLSLSKGRRRRSMKQLYITFLSDYEDIPKESKELPPVAV